ncbi:MAG: hypothetical protein MZU91_01295 [Desulfosudis oleivorans]|nr:hypothetical protein [Desulfosudis oleivorans]
MPRSPRRCARCSSAISPTVVRFATPSGTGAACASGCASSCGADGQLLLESLGRVRGIR